MILFTGPQDGVIISLDAAQIAFIDPEKLVLSLKGGELYVLTLCADSMRSVRNFHFSKAASSVLTSCVSSKQYYHSEIPSYIQTNLLVMRLCRGIPFFGLPAW